MRAILIVLDSAGIGELPDAADYGDTGSNTLLNIQKAVPDMSLHNMNVLGLSRIDGAGGLSKKAMEPKGCFCKLAEKSQGKDTTTGHWEIAGIVTTKAFPTFPNGFPKEVMQEFEHKTGCDTIGNCVASGTEIIKKLGDLHISTGALIVYTSADSVFQIAAHEAIVPIKRLYEICRIAREMLVGEYNVSRVIARPFTGESGCYVRTGNRKDFSLLPTGTTMLDSIKIAGLEVAAVGKIEDIFAGKGITKAVHTKSNDDGINETIAYMKNTHAGLIFTNLVDFDMIYGHRNDPLGYANALTEFDKRLPGILGNMNDDDMLMITADHGCDPTTKSTDHSREYIPLLIYGKRIKAGVNLGVRGSFADIGATILDYLNVKNENAGISFLEQILVK